MVKIEPFALEQVSPPSRIFKDFGYPDTKAVDGSV